jgi:MoaA/NifB/PqqE/SkfB family radical SAM enzyme
VANIGYIQVVRHCNHLCGFCSNPTSPYTHDFESMKVLVDDLVAREYFGVILTGGEPTLHPDLPRICRYARESGLHVRMITNGPQPR